MDVEEFKQKLQEYIDLQYEKLQETRRLEQNFEARNIWEKDFQKTETAGNILLEYIETLKYTKKGFSKKLKVFYKEIEEVGFEDFSSKFIAMYKASDALTNEGNRQRYIDFINLLERSYSIFKQILNYKY